MTWYLEGYLDDPRALRRFHVNTSPFIVGRSPNLSLTLNIAALSRYHAELSVEGEMLRVRDLGSRNGTFVNQRRIDAPVLLRVGDIIHFGTCEFRVGCERLDLPDDFVETCRFDGDLSAQFALGTREFLDMLDREAVIPNFQPLLQLSDGSVFGYEVLGRGGIDGLSTMPKDLFPIALSLGLEDRLSRLFRRKGVELGGQIRGKPPLFLNVHPSEMDVPEVLLNSLREIRQLEPEQTLVLEVSEAMVTDPDAIKELRAGLNDLNIRLAYDDFGAGQARLLELVEIPPDFLKFDITLIQNLHQSGTKKHEMVKMLVSFARDTGIITIAEGVETEPDALACRDLKFEIGQGYFFGRPAPLEAL